MASIVKGEQHMDYSFDMKINLECMVIWVMQKLFVSSLKEVHVIPCIILT